MPIAGLKRSSPDDDLNSQKATYWYKPTKKRFTYQSNDHVHQEGYFPPTFNIPFFQLLSGKESRTNAKLRYDLYQRNWNVQEEKIHSLLNKINLNGLNEILSLIEEPSEVKIASYYKIQSGLLLMGSNISNNARVFEQLQSHIEESGSKDLAIKTVLLSSKSCSNIKAVLSQIVRQLILESNDIVSSDLKNQDNESSGDEDDDEDIQGDGNDQFNVESYHQHVIYDLDVIDDWCQIFYKNETSDKKVDVRTTSLRIVIMVQDADSFDINVLIALIKILHSYSIKIPIKLIMGISTSLSVFSTKLPNKIVRLIQGYEYNMENSTRSLDEIANGLILTIPEPVRRDSANEEQECYVMLGPNMINNILSRFRGSANSVESFTNELKLCYMMHFFNQPLVLLSSFDKQYLESKAEELPSEYFQAFRKLPSFRRHITMLAKNLENTETNDLVEAKKTIKGLLDDEDSIKKFVTDRIMSFQQYAAKLLECVEILHLLEVNQSSVSSNQPKTKLELYSLIASGKFFHSLYYDELVLNMLKLSTNEIVSTVRFLKDLHGSENTQDNNANYNLNQLKMTLASPNFVRRWDEFNSPEGRFYEIEGLSASGKMSINYIAEILVKSLKQYFEYFISNPLKMQVFHEIFMVDHDSVLNNLLVPQLRPTLELSLSDSRSYLRNLDGTNSVVEPIICELFRLYREASININIYDFFMAFKNSVPKQKLIDELISILKDGEFRDNNGLFVEEDLDRTEQLLHQCKGDENEDEWEKVCLSMFYNGISELSILGLLKEKNKKNEVLEKAIWRGL